MNFCSQQTFCCQGNACVRGQLLQKQFTCFLLSALKWNCIYSIHQGNLQMEQEEWLGLQRVNANLSVQAQSYDYWNTEDPIGSGADSTPLFFIFPLCRMMENFPPGRGRHISQWRGGILLWSRHREGQKNAKNKFGSQLHPCLGLVALTPNRHICVYSFWSSSLWFISRNKIAPTSFYFQLWAVHASSPTTLKTNGTNSLGDSSRDSPRDSLPWMSRDRFPIHWRRPRCCGAAAQAPVWNQGALSLLAIPWDSHLLPALPSPALHLHGLPRRLPPAWCYLEPWFEGGWMIISSPLQNWSGRICFSWCNFRKATGTSSQGATHTSGLSILFFLLPWICAHT